MRKIVDYVEGLLHGRYTGRDLVRREAPPLSAWTLGAIVIVAGAAYGACMALYGARWGSAYGWPHVLAVMVKVPLLFLLTLVVTAPSLHVFAALARSGLAFAQTVRLLLSATALALVVLVSLAPVTAFFTFSTKSHPFMQLLNAAFFTVSGVVALRFVWTRLSEALLECEYELARRDAALDEVADEGGDRPEPPKGRAHAFSTQRARVGRVFLAWFVIYGSVAAQMGWLLRPFVGSPNLPQTFLRETEHNIFWGLAEALEYLD